MAAQDSPGWMPVFVVFPATSHAVATVASEGESQKLNAKITRPGKTYLQRIGTAHVQSDGAFYVQLVAIPVSGKLFIRPPHEGERMDPTEIGQ